ncbi:MAG: hypothetical protein Q9187_002840 [Circinaria calcarea]
MSEPIPESIPTSQDPRSKRPTKRLALTPTTQQATQLSALFAKPDREIPLPTSSALTTANHRSHNFPPPPEIVANVQGSSAGAGSGEFHVYKASRRREYERLRLMDEEVKREKADAEFEKEREEKKRRDEAKTSKNKARREKLKARKGEKGQVKEKSGEEMPGVEATRKEDFLGKLGNGVSSKDDGGEITTDAVPSNPEEIGVTIHDDD